MVEPAAIYQRGPGTASRVSGYPLVGTDLDWDDFFTRDYGTAPRDQPARDIIQRYNSQWHPGVGYQAGELNPFDVILSLEPGFRIRDNIAKLLAGWPLGLFVKVLRDKATIRLGSPFGDYFVDSLVLVGNMMRVTNGAEKSRVAVPNPYLHHEGEEYFPIEIVRDVEEFNVMQYPLGRVQWTLPVGIYLEDQAVQPPISNFSLYRHDPKMFWYDLTLESYINGLTNFAGGSDIQFFLFGEKMYIARRFRSYRDTSNVGNIRNAAAMRTAGLRQVLLYDYSEGFAFKDRALNYFQFYDYFIPGASSGQNCFLGCIEWCCVKEFEYRHRMERLSSFSLAQVEEEILGLNKDVLFDEDHCRNLTRRSIQKALDQRLGEECCIDSKKEWYKKKYFQGFPTVEMRAIAQNLFENDKLEISLWRRSPKGEWVDILKPTSPRVRNGDIADYVQIVLFQMSDEGLVVDLERSKSEALRFRLESGIGDGTLGHMTHCCGVYPPPYFFTTDHPAPGKEGRLRGEFRKQLDLISKPYLDGLYKKSVYFPEIEWTDIQKLVSAQNERISRGETSTLIFNPSKKFRKNASKKRKRQQELLTSSSSSSSEVNTYPHRDIPRNFVYAYDIETVDNTMDLQETCVYGPFRKVLTNDAPVEPIESQIPFSAQWIGVNVSDEGLFLQRKLDAKIEPLDYLTSLNSSSYEYFTTEGHIDYGKNQLLGECIESFLVSIAADIKDRGGEIGYIYACNGSKFDAYVILQFQRFQIESLMKTSRGILYARLRVPIINPGGGDDYDYMNDSSPKVTIVLRDLSLIVPGSLKRLCKGFDVPAEFVKLDFPIQMVNGRNCYNPKIMEACKEYALNDVYSLGVIIKKVNALIGNSMWNPANIHSDKPPIVQFLTCMSMIRKSTQLHFKKVLPPFLHPKSIDIPGLRNWLIQAAIGGRVTPYAKTYVSPYFKDIITSYNGNDVDTLKTIHQKMIEYGECMQCLDFTSLYPFVMDSCPMPMGNLVPLHPSDCEEHIRIMGCDACDMKRSLCTKHRYYFMSNDSSLRPFSIIIVRNVRMDETKRKGNEGLRNLCPRKTYNASTMKSVGLNYSLESNDEFYARMGQKEKMLDTQAFSNVDLYWMRRQGFLFDIVGGYSWNPCMVYNSFIGPAFQMRIEAKKQGNKLLSDFLKLNYNGAYGITIQQDIDDAYFMTRIGEEYKYCNPLDSQVHSAILASFNGNKNESGLLCSEELTGEGIYFPNKQACFQKRKKPHLQEFFADQSPMQIGAAILSYARHIGNLILFNISPDCYTYTDTDSIAISEKVLLEDEAIQSMIQNSDDAPMGSLKNDHNDNNGTDPRIVFSMIGTKKVKCHVTLNGEGEIQIFNTFKGLNVSLDVNGKKMNPAYSEYMTTKALLDINMRFTSDPVEVQSWKRDLQFGVSISNHIQVLEKETYMSDFCSLRDITTPAGRVEYMIPHGYIGDYDATTISERKLLYSDYVVNLKEFIEKYYVERRHALEEYNPGTEEYREILSLFESEQ